jgi:hypothetical protein
LNTISITACLAAGSIVKSSPHHATGVRENWPNKKQTIRYWRCEFASKTRKVTLLKGEAETDRRRGRIGSVMLTMKHLLILLLGFAFTCSVKATVIADLIVQGLPVKVVSPSKSYKVFEQYPWEGRSSKYGPKGNRLNSSYGVGVGKNIRRSLRVRHGDWIHMPDIGWRRINESSSKSNGIEFFATHRDQYKSKHPRITIDKVVFALPSQQPDRAPYRPAGPIPTNSGNLSSAF